MRLLTVVVGNLLPGKFKDELNDGVRKRREVVCEPLNREAPREVRKEQVKKRPVMRVTQEVHLLLTVVSEFKEPAS